jgi:hypothetical protein
VQWAYGEFVGIQASPKATNEFIISLKKKGMFVSLDRGLFEVFPALQVVRPNR